MVGFAPPKKSSKAANHRKAGRKGSIRVTLLLFILILLLIAWEIQTSWLQARVFSTIAAKFTYTVLKGQSQDIRFPGNGPYDIRMGYDRIPEWTRRLTEKGYIVSAQARWSPELIKYTDFGIFPIYREKMRAGLMLSDWQNREVLRVNFPQRVYPDFDDIPSILIRMLLYVENRYLLDPSTPYGNPAIEWKRQVKALADAAISLVDENHHVSGGSTLATQIEKFRHSPGGVTMDAGEKLRQIASASFRSYHAGERTLETRKQIVLDYINSIPLAAISGFGEVNGLGDGLWAWYGMEFDTVNQILTEAENNWENLSPEKRDEFGVVIKSALSLFLAHRRPSDFLIGNQEALEALANSYLRLLAEEGFISRGIRDTAMAARLQFRKEALLSYPIGTLPQRKTANLVRSRLLTYLGIQRVYDLDRVDLSVRATLDLALQQKVTEKLNSFKDASVVRSTGLHAPHLLEKGDPSKVVYSFSLYERSSEGNMLRVQTNSYDGPFNIDEQTKLDLGSSAKLRTMVHYLEIIHELHGRYSGTAPADLKKLSREPALDPLTQWATLYLASTPDKNLSSMLQAAMERKYSASPAERFFTGGGMHSFSNYKKEDNGKVVSVRKAFNDSVNLPFIRMMRDISFYHVYRRYGVTPRMVEKLDEAKKRSFLSIFADKEGIQFVRRFYQKYQPKNSSEIRQVLFSAVQPTPKRLAPALRYLYPSASLETFTDFLRESLPDSKLTQDFLEEIYDMYDSEKFSLADIGYLANIHPLELWVARCLIEKPDTSISKIIEDSADERQDVYQWLFRTKRRYKQYQRIRTMIELEAFQDIHRAWKRAGYPFDTLVPSYATAIGSSADRPGSLAELAGIIQNKGVRNPLFRIESLHFGKDTPYETLLTLSPNAGEQVLAPEIAMVLKQAMLDVVNEGTAIRLRNGISLPDGAYLHVGGKTGTGDHRYKVFGPGGAILQSKVMNRAATFVFILGDQYFGTITAFVAGGEAENYEFSSSLPVSILKMILSEVTPILHPQVKME